MTIVGLAKFEQTLKDFMQKQVPAAQVVVMKKVVFEGLKGITKKMPVITGHAKRNTQVTIGAAATEELDGVDMDGSSTINAGLAKLQGLAPYTDVYITNNVPYIDYIENGTEKMEAQAPFANTVEELQAMFI